MFVFVFQVLTHFLFFFLPLCFFAIYPAVKMNLDPRNYPFLMETMSWQPIYCFLLPILLFLRRKELRRRQQSVITSICVTQGDDVELRSDGRTLEQVRHFEMLKELWNPKNTA